MYMYAIRCSRKTLPVPVITMCLDLHGVDSDIKSTFFSLENKSYITLIRGDVKEEKRLNEVEV